MIRPVATNSDASRLWLCTAKAAIASGGINPSSSRLWPTPLSVAMAKTKSATA